MLVIMIAADVGGRDRERESERDRGRGRDEKAEPLQSLFQQFQPETIAP